MEDKMLDDDIIDLTDLLEEGQPPGEKEAPFSINEPDSFDLGKEISMEYDVSVDEIDSGDEQLDINVDLSSNEEEALSVPAPGDEDIITLEDTGESLDITLSDDFLATAKKEPEQGASNEGDFEPFEPGPDDTDMSDVFEQQETTDAEDESVSLGAGLVDEPSSPGEAPASETASAEEAVSRISTDEMLDEIRMEIPGMIEGVVRPFIAELVKEIIAASRDQLPGIVEKVIREEIDKLKKLDS